jgi:hypothetical protein
MPAQGRYTWCQLGQGDPIHADIASSLLGDCLCWMNTSWSPEIVRCPGNQKSAQRIGGSNRHGNLGALRTSLPHCNDMLRSTLMEFHALFVRQCTCSHARHNSWT